MKERFGSPHGFADLFKGGMGAAAIKELLSQIDLEAEAESLRDTIQTSKGQVIKSIAAMGLKPYPFILVGSVNSESLEEMDADILGFTRYAIAY